MVEEYNLDTNVVVRRAWRQKGNFGQDVGWVVEVGDPEPEVINSAGSLDPTQFRESSSSVSIV